MMHVVGRQIDNVNSYNINDEEINRINNDTVFVVLEDKIDTDVYLYYTLVKELILRNNRVILLINSKSTKVKYICMLMALYKQYDIYNIEDADIIDEEHLKILAERAPTEEEIKQYVDIDVIANEKLCDVLMDIGRAIDEDDIEALVNISTQYKDILCRSINVIGYLNYMVDNNTRDIASKLKEYKSTIAELEAKVRENTTQLKDVSAQLEQVLEDNKVLSKEAFEAKGKVMELETQLSNGGTIIKTYSTVVTSMVKCKTKSIIYFKEVSYVRYTNSFILKLMEIISKIHKLKVKLLVYDNKNAFNSVYKPINVIGSAEYMNNSDLFVNTVDKLVVVECNQAIIEDMLRADYDVLIIYDRLKQNADIVSGNNVYKYWVINGSNEYAIMERTFKIDKKHVVTRPGVFPESIPISEIKEYKTMTNSAGIANYNRMLMADGKKTVIEAICERTNILSIKPRG